MSFFHQMVNVFYLNIINIVAEGINVVVETLNRIILAKDVGFPHRCANFVA